MSARSSNGLERRGWLGMDVVWRGCGVLEMIENENEGWAMRRGGGWFRGGERGDE